MDFHKFGSAVSRQIATMSKHRLFCTAVEKDELWDTYLASFPAGSDPIYRSRTEHDCSCCRQFVKNYGNIVTIVENQVVSIWDVVAGDPNYQAVANSMSMLVKSREVERVFYSVDQRIGTEKNRELLEDGSLRQYEHFSAAVPAKSICKAIEIGPKYSNDRASYDVTMRGLKEITLDAVDTVLELIAQNSIYRGSDYKNTLLAFKKLKKDFSNVNQGSESAFVWNAVSDSNSALHRIRNTAIGTLLIDLSNGVDIDKAVRSFERIVAPENYKRPTAVVTKSMVENAKKKIEELGITTALNRRYANIDDITINNIIFANRESKKVITGDVFDDIISNVSTPRKTDKIETITIDKFISDVVPNAHSIELLVENRHRPNLVSLVAPEDSSAKHMFQWNNGFSWSYDGDVADSIKERVKNAGGNVTGDLCCRLAWYNYDDLDFHMIEPSGHEIYYGTRHTQSHSGGTLDVDMNVSPKTREPVENIVYKSRSKMREGRYKLFVRQFRKRETVDTEFDVEIDFLGTIYTFSGKSPAQSNDVTVVEFNYTHVGGIEIIKSMPISQSTRTMWNINTGNFHPVNVLMLSPNHWDEQGVGNKHFFFMIDKCINDGQARGFYNEFLKSELTPHRKVMEIVGSKMKTEQSDRQLSGLGFSSTMRNEVTVRVKGSFTRTLNVTF